MQTTNELKALCIHFSQNVVILKGRVRLIPFDVHTWFQCAYFSIQRTIPGGLTQSAYDHLRSALFGAVYTLQEQTGTADSFEKWIVSTIEEQSETYNISIGQSQRLTNLLLKYYYCYYNAEIDPLWNEEHHFIKQHSPFFHLPLDNYVLVSLKLKYACPDIHINREHTNATLLIGDETVSWSRLADIFTYVQLQLFVQEMMDNHLQVFDNALHFEMAELYSKP